MGPIIELSDLSKPAIAFLEMCKRNHEGRNDPGVGLDYKGWYFLAHAPIGGWPSKDIILAMLKHPKLKFIIPIDIVGMVTDTNPSNLYLREKEACPI